MAKVHQVIVRNTPEKGLDVVDSTLGVTRVHDITPFLPSGRTSELDAVYLTKFQYSPDSVALRFTFDDGADRFGRELIKTHTLLIDNPYYNEKTIQYFISPLISGAMSTESHNILNNKDFENIDIFPVPSKLVELSLCKKQVQLTSTSKRDPLKLIQMFGTIDRIIPPPLNPSFSFQTMSSPNIRKSYEEYSLVYSAKKLPHSHQIENLEKIPSEFPTIIALTEASSELSSLKMLQKQFFLGIPERKLRLKTHLRFGIKTISKARENLDMYFN
jgi:hypothetical protein